METTRVDLDDLDLAKPGAFWPYKCQFHTGTMLTMALERLAESNTDVTFVHSYPGLVNTGNLNRGWRGRWFLQGLANVVLAPFFFIIAISIQESRERTLYLLTSAKYGGRGVALEEGVVPGVTVRGEETGSVFLVNHWCGTVENEKVLTELRKGAKERIWERTVEVLGPYM
jgi:hypothetical protein